MKLTRDHLTVLLNTYYEDDGVRSITVRHPSDELGELLRIDLGGHDDTAVRFTTGPLSYEGALEDVARVHGEDAAADLPDEGHYARALAGAGLLDVENASDVAEIVDRHGYRDLAAGHHPLFVGLDTNLLPWYPESLLAIEPWRTDDAERPPVNGFALASGVKSELDFYYRNPETSRLPQAFGPEYERVEGQPVSDNRQGILGLYEYRQLMAERRVEEVQSETGDEAIVAAYDEFRDRNRQELLLFSNDHGFVDRARDRGLQSSHVRFPIDTPRKTVASWNEIERALYLLTVIFGVLELPKVTLYGVWPEKDGQDWQRERLSVDCRSPNYSETLSRRKAIVTAYEQSA
ncbi:hypothetical protein G9C85_09375 [Halorubellus sp. JP-L1]|uniref:hypothetical protein n=1 Tax=Halorubellus sp. JP-L1 TaxID=2715753 RepID=UPI00140CC70D|nr:hypothetical protein [Halorubellus sp. JP-L1]NHN41839.1 hypothetical protein [Halorubellus sp. JP-L1]